MKNYQIALDKQNYSQYHVIAYVNKKLCVILIDTGACSSHVSKHFINEVYDLETEIRYVKYDGELVINSKMTSVEIIFGKNLKVSLDIPIDNRIKQEEEVLLGIDFLENFDFAIKKNEVILDGISIPRINMYYKDIESIIRND